jgi:hypothetical protein
MDEGVIVGGEAYNGQPVVYFPADGQLDYDFAMNFNLLRKDKDGQPAGGYIDEHRHIKALKMRGLFSSGVVIPVSSLNAKYPDEEFKVGTEIDSIGGKQIVTKYVPRRNPNSTHQGDRLGKKYKAKSFKAIYDFPQHIDTSQVLYSQNSFFPGDQVNVSIKAHGTSQRSGFVKAELPNNWFRKLFRLKPKTEYKVVLGTRRTIVTPKIVGYYASNDFRWEHHNKLVPHLSKDMIIYYEVVGYCGPDKKIMPSGDNSKLKDKKFLKEFGPTTDFLYGCEPGESKMLIYRIVEDDREYTPAEMIKWCEERGFEHVWQVEDFIYTTWEDLLARLDKYFEDLHDPIGGHLKEGVVLRIVNRTKFFAAKHKTWEFKVLEGLIKEVAESADMEEAEEDNIE